MEKFEIVIRCRELRSIIIGVIESDNDNKNVRMSGLTPILTPILEIDGVPDTEAISKQLDEAEIPTTCLSLKGRSYIVIMGVNNRKVAERVWKNLR